MDNIKFSILILTYNQKDVIGKAIDSCFNQGLIPHEIIVADDCSTDGNQMIIENYVKKYGTIIKPIFNTENQWIYKNYNNAINYLTGDLVICLAGDDELLPNSIKLAQEQILNKKIDYKNKNICIVGNILHVYPNGKKIIHNNYLIKDNNPFKEMLRSGLSTRDFCYSVEVIKNNPINTNFGKFADTIRNLDIISKIDEFIFVNEIVNIYNIGVGVTSKISMSEYCKSGLLYIDHINIKNYPNLDKSDLIYLEFRKALIDYFTSSGIRSIFKYSVLIYKLIINYNNFSILSPFKSKIKYLIPFYDSIAIFVKKIIFNKR